jgi:hypothetical protein
MSNLLDLDFEYWPFIAPIVLGLMLLVWHGPKWLGRSRWVAPIIALPTAIPLALSAMYEVYKFPLTRTLYHNEIVAGRLLPAGSRIRFRDWEHTYFEFIQLPRVTEIDGIPFTGTVSYASGGDTPGRWYGTLAVDHMIDGWPCARGEITTRWGSKLLTCQLATAHAFFDFELPASTTVYYSNIYRRIDSYVDIWHLELPPDKGIAIKALSTTAPAGVALWVTGDGYLLSIRLRERQIIIVHGVPLRANIEVVGKGVVGEIAESFVVAGGPRPAGTRVSIDLAEAGWSCQNGKVRLPHDGSLWTCQLASAHTFFGYDLPAGTTVDYGGNDYTWHLNLPPDKGLAIKALSATVPAGVDLWFTDKGRLHKIRLNWGETIVARGVPLKGDVYVSEEAVNGKLAQPFVVADEQQLVGTPVEIELTTGTVSLLPNCVCPK